MAQTLAEEFLADLDELSDEPISDNEQDGDADVQGAGEVGSGDSLADELDDLEALNYDDLTAVAKLMATKNYKDIMERVRAALEAVKGGGGVDTVRHTSNIEDDPTYKLLVQCNRLAVDIDAELTMVHTYCRDKYRPKFPELESLVHHPVDYARVVSRIGNEMDLTLVDLDDLLPAATIMVVTVTGTTTSGKPLSPEQLQRVQDGCAMTLALDADKRAILEFVESRMSSIAPNLSAVVGSEIAARLMGVAGGLSALSSMPACNIQVLGAKRKNLAGFSTATAQPHQGFIYNCPVMQQTPPALRSKAVRLIGAKCALMARVDAYGQDPTGNAGATMLAEIKAKIEKWQEPPPAKTVKPLPRPDEGNKKRRGGRRARKLKEMLGITDMRKAANRVNFGQAEEEYIDGDEVVGLGVLGKEGSGRLRVVAQQARLKISAKTAKRARVGGGTTTTNGLQTSGLQTSLAFSAAEGMTFIDPSKQPGGQSTGLAQRSGTDSYFSALSGFRSVRK